MGKPFNLTEEVFKNKKGYMFGRTSAGDLFIGYEWNPEFYKDTEENREKLLKEWEFNKVFA